MENIYLVNKPAGLTPLQAIEILKQDQSYLAQTSLTYAGRLDPMAEGLLLLLAGEEINHKEKYLNLPKKYVATILLGFQSDSYDALGMTTAIDSNTSGGEEKIKSEISKLANLGAFTLPPYSSVPVQGKPLFQWAQEGRLTEIEIPQRSMKILNILLNKIYSESPEKVLQYITDTINKVRGDFRQQEIIDNWENLLKKEKSPLQLLEVEIECESGTYVRSIVNQLGTDLKCGALLLKLTRTAIGDYQLDDAIQLA